MLPHRTSLPSSAPLLPHHCSHTRGFPAVPLPCLSTPSSLSPVPRCRLAAGGRTAGIPIHPWSHQPAGLWEGATDWDTIRGTTFPFQALGPGGKHTPRGPSARRLVRSRGISKCTFEPGNGTATPHTPPSFTSGQRSPFPRHRIRHRVVWEPIKKIPPSDSTRSGPAPLCLITLPPPPMSWMWVRSRPVAAPGAPRSPDHRPASHCTDPRPSGGAVAGIPSDRRGAAHRGNSCRLFHSHLCSHAHHHTPRSYGGKEWPECPTTWKADNEFSSNSGAAQIMILNRNPKQQFQIRRPKFLVSDGFVIM